MPLSLAFNAPLATDAVELSVEDAILDTWVEDTGNYLRLDLDELTPPEGLPSDQA